MSVFRFDFDRYDWAWYDFVARRVTGHSMHAVNGLVPCLLVSWWVPLSWTYVLAVVFYTVREWPLESADNWGDVLWVYAVLLSLWGPWWAALFGVVALVYDVWYWLSRKAPGWMPRDRWMLSHWRVT